jgi:hypothetical protein
MIKDSDLPFRRTKQHTPHRLRWAIALRLWIQGGSVASENEITALGK